MTGTPIGTNRGALARPLLLALLAAAATLAAPRAVGAEETVRLMGEDGRTFTALAEGPANAPRAVLLLHDWFGITDMTRQAAARLAASGYRVLALDLYDGRSAATHAEAAELMGSVDRPTRDAALRAALAHLAASHRRVAVLGFSMGGFEAYRAAVLSSEPLAAVAIIYGGSFEQGIEAIRDRPLPLLSITGSDDAWALDSTLAAMTALKPAEGEQVAASLELHILPGARHAYAQPLYAGGDNYDPEATRVTWMILEDFLSRHLLADSVG